MSENWDFYPCRVEGQLASIMLNLGLAQVAPISTLPDCAWLQVIMKSPREDGLSSSEEFDRLCEIGDALDAAFAEAPTSLRYVGRCTSGGQRSFYAYAESGLVAESLLSSVMTAFPEYEYDTGFREDKEWVLYREFLYPDERSLELIWTRRVLDGLEKAGDSLEQCRPVRHFANFQQTENADSFAGEITEAGFTVLANEHNEQTSMSRVTFERVDPITLSEICDVTADLRRLTNSYGGEYDGWETQILSEEPSSENLATESASDDGETKGSPPDELS